MVGIVRAWCAVVTIMGSTIMGAVAVAAPAAADQGDFLRSLLPKYTYLTSEQLYREAAVACQVTRRSGRPGSDAVPVVRNDLRDLQVSVAVAGEIVAAALLYLPC